MWGFASDMSWICLALKPCDGSTGIAPEYHLPGDFSVNWYVEAECWNTSSAPFSPPPILSMSLMMS